MAKLAVDRRKPMVFAASVIGAVMILSSAAYACVQTRGEIFVTGDNGITSTAVGNGHHPGAGPGNYSYCKNGKYLKAGAKSAGDGGVVPRGSFSVQLGLPPTDCQYLEPNPPVSPWISSPTIPNVFLNGTYEVYFCQGQRGEFVFSGSPDRPVLRPTRGSCFFSDGVTDYGVLVGTMTVAGNVAGPKTFHVPFGAVRTPAGTYAGVSVRRTAGPPCGCGPPPVNLAPIALI